MNRRFNFVSIIATVFLCFNFFTSTAFAVEVSDSNINELLSPYREVMQAVGSEFGYSPKIPEGEEISVYNNLKNYTLEEFEKSLRESYICALSLPDTINVKTNGKIIETTEIYSDGSIKEYTYEENAIDITPMRSPVSRSYEYRYVGDILYYVYVDVKIMLDPPSFDSFVDWGYYTSTAQNYFKPNSCSHSFNSGATELYCTYKGTVLTPTGIDLIVVKTLSVTYFPY